MTNDGCLMAHLREAWKGREMRRERWVKTGQFVWITGKVSGGTCLTKTKQTNFWSQSCTLYCSVKQ